ncbi:MAG: type II toxin-antitoxin system VapC family toxin [Planctomycetota bacterium]|nr:type II toxin-antitoxin system VapC family toxin [Planctomycetota bacterium]MDA1141756.1 type II toxin-antitoxin system VapC family toxin [Planctomycetota bacterium]
MKLLLDTSVFLWFISGDQKLSLVANEAILNPENDVFLSVVSLCEVIVKHDLGKLPLPSPPESYIPSQRAKHAIQSLGLDESSVQRLPALPSIHRDPFDRMLICQAIHHDLTLVTTDSTIRSYPVAVL